jgi:hypothetical protein
MNDIEALKSSIQSRQDAVVLCDIARSLVDAGMTQESLLGSLEHLRSEFHNAGDSEAEDITLEVMDYVVGWCSPHMRI